MIKISNEVFPSPEYMKMVILGARNSFCSRDRSDSTRVVKREKSAKGNDILLLGSADTDLLSRLAKGNTAESKYLRMMHVIFDMSAPLYFWKQFDTYKVGTVSNSESTMHSLTKHPLTIEDFSTPYGMADGEEWHEIIDMLNALMELYNLNKDKQIWGQLISMLPNGYNQMRTIDINYATLKQIYNQRKGHKLGEWAQFINWMMDIPYAGLIFGDDEVYQKHLIGLA